MEREVPPSEIQEFDHIWAEDVGLWVRVRRLDPTPDGTPRAWFDGAPFVITLAAESYRVMRPEPKLRSSHDGIYPRCVWCNGENYMPAVIAYSSGEIPCAAVGNCGRYLPEHYKHYVRKEERDG